MRAKVLQAMVAVLICASAEAQVNSGSDGHDGAFNPTTNTVINMADHPDGIYHYTEVNIPAGVTVSFVPNAANTPVVWLVQSNCLVSGGVDLSGQTQTEGTGGGAGPGGFRGGNGGNNPGVGFGPGGGAAAIRPYGNSDAMSLASSASYASVGWTWAQNGPEATLYGSQFLLPLVGGSGGGGGGGLGGGGGGGVLLLAAQNVVLYGTITANGGNGVSSGGFGNSSGAGSGGGIRIYASLFRGNGGLSVSGGSFFASTSGSSYASGNGGNGRIRIDCTDSQFGGSIGNQFTEGFQPILIPFGRTGVQINILSVGGSALPANPSSTSANPAVVVPAQQSNPVLIVVGCSNLPLHTPVTVSVKPANGAMVSAVGYNNTGTVSNSTATVLINMPRGGGVIYATAATGN